MQRDETQARVTGAKEVGSEQYSLPTAVGVERSTAAVLGTKAEAPRLMKAVVERANMRQAYRKVVANKGAAGVDGVTIPEFAHWLKVNWPSIRMALLSGSYQPRVVRAVDLPKPSGGVRTLGIPTLVDRLIQQALLQILQPLFDPGFSESSYGFRPGRGAHQAIKAAQSYVLEGRRWVVDLDLESFFDRVNHDLVMSRVARQVKDPRVLKLIRRFLQTGLMRDGVITRRDAGTPQGGPLSPLLSNLLLDDLDRELERRGHVFCRYADDCNIYVRTQKAGLHALAEMTAFLAKRLKLKVNASKSAVDRPWRRKFLGYSFTAHRQARLRIAPESIRRLKAKVREQMRRGRGRSLWATIAALTPLLRGWMAYFRLTETKGVLQELDGWIRRRLRAVLWRHWKRTKTRASMLKRRGLDELRAWRSATNGRGPWWNAGASHMNAAFPKRFFDTIGLVSLLDCQRRFQSVS